MKRQRILITISFFFLVFFTGCSTTKHIEPHPIVLTVTSVKQDGSYWKVYARRYYEVWLGIFTYKPPTKAGEKITFEICDPKQVINSKYNVFRRIK